MEKHMNEDDDLEEFLRAVAYIERRTTRQPAPLGRRARADVVDAVVGTPYPVAAAAATANRALGVLTSAALRGSVLERRQAHSTIASLIHNALDPYRSRLIVPPRPFRAATVFEGFLRKSRQLFRIRWSRRVETAWTPLGFAVTLAAAGAVLNSAYNIAAILLLVRSLVSVTMRTPGFASDPHVSDEDDPTEWRVDWAACVMGHMTDAVVLMSIALHLVAERHETWGMLAGTVPLAMLGATLLRLAAAQGGVVLQRLQLERVARNVPIIIALGLASVAERRAVLPLMGATVGAAAFAALEVVRTVVYTRLRQQSDRVSGRGEAVARRAANVLPLVEATVAQQAPDAA